MLAFCNHLWGRAALSGPDAESARPAPDYPDLADLESARGIAAARVAEAIQYRRGM